MLRASHDVDRFLLGTTLSRNFEALDDLDLEKRKIVANGLLQKFVDDVDVKGRSN